jgi:dimethylglycine dehydrogenase
VVGEVTSAAYGYRCDQAIALGMVRIDAAVAGTQLEIDVFGKRMAAVVREDQPLWDPENARIRA